MKLVSRWKLEEGYRGGGVEAIYKDNGAFQTIIKHVTLVRGTFNRRNTKKIVSCYEIRDGG